MQAAVLASAAIYGRLEARIMIIMSLRFRPGDMKHWNEMLVVDRENAKTDAYRRRVDEACSLIAEFGARHSQDEYYNGLSY